MLPVRSITATARRKAPGVVGAADDEMLGAQPDHHALAGLAAALEAAAWAAPARSSATLVPSSATVPSTKFIAGEPMKPATKRLAGRS